MRFRANWYVTTDLEPAWDLRETGWRVQMLGDTPLDLESGSPWRPSATRRCRPASPPTPRSTPSRWSARRSPASAWRELKILTVLGCRRLDLPIPTGGRAGVVRR